MAPLKVLIFGATGAQGGSVAKYLLEQPDKFKLYGLTRHTDSGHAKQLSSQGVTMLQGDLDDPASYEDALKQVDAVFLNTNWWQWYRPDGKGGDNADECTERETKQAIAVADAMKRIGTKHLCYSTLGTFTIDGKKVAHSESKVISECFPQPS